LGGLGTTGKLPASVCDISADRIGAGGGEGFSSGGSQVPAPCLGRRAQRRVGVETAGLLSRRVGVVLSALCRGVRFRPHTICAIAQRQDKADKKEGGARGMVRVYSQRARGIYQLGRVPGKSEKAAGKRYAIPVPATTNSSARRSRLATGAGNLREMRPTNACGISQTARSSVSGLHLWACPFPIWRKAMPAHLRP